MQPTLERAVAVAALSKLPSGRRHPHQRRIPAPVLEEAKDRLLASDLRSCRTFHDLFETVGRAIGGIRGAGELLVYDVAHRMARTSAWSPIGYTSMPGRGPVRRALGLFRGQEFLEPEALPEPFQRLSPAENRGLPVYLQGRSARRAVRLVRGRPTKHEGEHAC